MQRKMLALIINLQTFYLKIHYEMDKNPTVLAKCEFYFFQMFQKSIIEGKMIGYICAVMNKMNHHDLSF